MKKYSTKDIRNFCIVGHTGSGKTSLCEALLFTAGATKRLGKVDAGNSILDTDPEEINRKITIYSALAQFEYAGKKINIIDCPGYIDFIGNIKAAMKVTETSVIMIDAQTGPEVGTEKAMEFVEEYNPAHLFFVNKIDKEHSKFDEVVKMLQATYGTKVVVITFPMGEAANLKGVISLLTNKAYTGYANGKGKAVEIPAEFKEKYEKYRTNLLDTIAETDEALMEKYLGGEELTEKEIMEGLVKGFAAGSIIPVLCGNASENIGMDVLLDFFTNICPSPEGKKFKVQKNNEVKELEINSADPLLGLIFKTSIEMHVGEMSYIKVFSGKLTSGMEVNNITSGNKEKIGTINCMIGKEKTEIDQIEAGDIAVLVKLKSTKTNDTLAEKSDSWEIVPILFPNPVVEEAIEAKDKNDEDKISTGLAKLRAEDPSFLVKVDTQVNQTKIYGMGEAHLDIICKKLKERYGVEVNLVKPKIPYRETITKQATCHKKYKKQSGGKGQYGEVHMELFPAEKGTGLEFINNIVGGAIPAKFIPAVEKGVIEAMDRGVLAGYKVVDVKCRLFDGSYHDVDSSEMAFKLAASMAFQEGAKAASPVLLEPICKVEIKVPEEYLGDVMGDLNSRRGRINGIDQVGRFQLIKAEVPLAELYRYSTQLRSLTQGRGIYTQEVTHYDTVPHEITVKIVEEAKKHMKEEAEE